MVRKSAIEMDAARGVPVFFKKKEYADRAKTQAKKHNIKVRLTRVKGLGQYKYKLSFVK